MAITSTDLLREVRTEFLLTYGSQAGVPSQLASCMRLGIPSTRRTEYYGYHESAPELERWDRGEAMSEDEFLSRAFSVANLNWGKLVGWHEDDAEDLQLSGFLERARQVAVSAKKIPLRVFFQILTAGSDSKLLQAIPNAPDGAALYAATAEGADRFGVSGGNLLTGSGVASAGAIRTDFWNAINRMLQFLNTEGEPLLDDSDGEIVIPFNVANQEVFTEAFKQERTLQIVDASGTNVGGAAVTNSIKEASFRVTLWPTSRITDNDWTIFLNDPQHPKPIFEQVRQAIRVREINASNSKRSITEKRMGIAADMRAGYGVALPYTTVKVNN